MWNFLCYWKTNHHQRRLELCITLKETAKVFQLVTILVLRITHSYSYLWYFVQNYRNDSAKVPFLITSKQSHENIFVIFCQRTKAELLARRPFIYAFVKPPCPFFDCYYFPLWDVSLSPKHLTTS